MVWKIGGSDVLRVIVHGYLGQMGQVISDLIATDENFKLVAGIDKSAENQNLPNVYGNIENCRDTADVIIDFSNPSAIDGLLKYAVDHSTALVIGTTGYEKGEMKKLEKAGEEIPIFYSANMSLGINLLLNLVSKPASVLGEDFDIEIIEKHHNKKIDAPSGTAYMIANKINNEIGIHAIRGGTIVGEHSVIFAGLDEILEIKHSASSKNVFGKGALEAAKFISKQNNGLYSMKDLMI